MRAFFFFLHSQKAFLSIYISLLALLCRETCACWGGWRARSLSPDAEAWSSLQQLHNTNPGIGQQSIAKAYPQYIWFDTKWQAAKHFFLNFFSVLRCATGRLRASYCWSRSHFMWPILLRVLEQQMHSYLETNHGIHSQPHFQSFPFHTLWSCTLLWHYRFGHRTNSSSVTVCS